ITNPGVLDLTISTWASAGSDAFTITGIPSTVPAGDQSSFTVSFAPASIGVFIAGINIANDSTNSQYMIYLKGEGVKAEQAALVFEPADSQTYDTINTLSVTGGSGDGAVTYSVVSGPGEIVDGDGLKVTSGVGTITVMATKEADENYNAISVTAQVECVKAEQTIDFPAIPQQLLEDQFTLTATASSGLPVTFSVTDGPGIVTDKILSFSDVGTVTVMASQEGDDNWKSAVDVNQSFEVVFGLIEVPVPVYRLYSYGAPESTYEHLWTTDEKERDLLDSWPSWVYEGVAWLAYTNQVDGSVPLYRLYAELERQHHYTNIEFEYQYLAGDGTWNDEGVQYYVFPTNTVDGLLPVYRFNHEELALHHFTIDENEKDEIIRHPEWGYEYEGIGYYVFPVVDDEELVLE
ncbi:MAG: hypothetical protein GX811_06255, partial [Lentisphaerae bacterium]|nr:hypothetical protein [Lentisphaerota bacterium]